VHRDLIDITVRRSTACRISRTMSSAGSRAYIPPPRRSSNGPPTHRKNAGVQPLSHLEIHMTTHPACGSLTDAINTVRILARSSQRSRRPVPSVGELNAAIAAKATTTPHLSTTIDCSERSSSSIG